MERVYWSAERPFDQINHVGIAIKTALENQRHTGILHRDQKTSEIVLLHLRSHHQLVSVTPDLSYLWIDPKVNPRRLRHVATICRLIWEQNGKDVPFGFSGPSDCFDDETFAFLVGPSKLGLTCATFILAVFERAGVKLLKHESWPVRADD